MSTVPADHMDLLERPIVANLATVRPDGTPQVNPMWFVSDGTGTVVRFTHTDQRQKYRNIQLNPNVAVAIQDPDNTSRYLEVRGVVSSITPDPEGDFFRELAVRYGRDFSGVPLDASHRVILEVTIDHATWM